MLRISPLVLALLLPLAGCGGYQPAPMPKAPPGSQAKVPAKPAPAPAAAPAASPAQQSGMTAGMTAIGTAVGMAPLETAVQGPMGVAPAGGQPGATYQKAETAVASQRPDLGRGLVATPVSVYFQTRDRITFLLVQDALNKYKGFNGHAPKTHDDFMKMLQENQIRLPQLREPGTRYLYDPSKEELMVEHPR